MVVERSGIKVWIDIMQVLIKVENVRDSTVAVVFQNKPLPSLQLRNCVPGLIRGKCKVVQYSDLRSASHFVPCPDHFFYILAYRPDNRRLATTQGEIRVGPSHQARLPECRPGTSPGDMPEKCERWEEIRWRPGRVVDGDLLMYLRAARSIAAFAGMVGGTTDDRCEAEAMDETTVNALDTLHKYNYDTSKSLQALVKGPSVMYIEKKWSEDDVGLRDWDAEGANKQHEMLPNLGEDLHKTASPQQGDPRLSGPLSGQGAGGEARTIDRMVPRSQDRLANHCDTVALQAKVEKFLKSLCFHWFFHSVIRCVTCFESSGPWI
ncbi:Arginine-glutamic acid dipeptide repeats protein [Plakobranchus ocellatus]|uniref:Arginine-glutamic acid dipeptide repeats protein n=1 Tax=Plakobranchus ocellatus TaxID=259542 RepID=A0AAV4DED2_9GAST|nr:Arginine-glutamic acid dipeptide repeats protein [Plakobranchus ocellatus]